MAFPLYSVTNFLEYTGLRTMEQTQVVKIYLLPLAFIAQTATIWVTVLVAFNRYIAVCKPFKAARLCTVVQVSPYRHSVLKPSQLSLAVPQWLGILAPSRWLSAIACGPGNITVNVTIRSMKDICCSRWLTHNIWLCPTYYLLIIRRPASDNNVMSYCEPWNYATIVTWTEQSGYYSAVFSVVSA